MAFKRINRMYLSNCSGGVRNNMNSREKLKELLKELFRIESSDLDFGIYRIMNQKRKEINDFIENDLDKHIDKVFINIEDSNKKELEEKIEKKLKKV